MNEADKFLQEYLEKANRNTQKTTRGAFSFESPRPQATQQTNHGAAPFGVNARVQQQKQTTYTRTAHTEVKSGVQYAPQQGVQYEVPMGEAWNRFWASCTFNGRASRSEFWYVQLILVLINSCLTFLGLIPYVGLVIGIVGGIFGVIAWIKNICLLVRRLHDTGKSGWFFWLGLIPFVGGILLLIFECQGSEPYENKYGPVPNVR